MALPANFPHYPDLPGLCSVRHGLRLMSIDSRLLDPLEGGSGAKNEESDRLENMPSLTRFGNLDGFAKASYSDASDYCGADKSNKPSENEMANAAICHDLQLQLGCFQ